MKGLTIIRALPSNAIDIYPLIEQAAKEGVFTDSPSGKELKTYYFNLIEELCHPYHFWFLAKRGRGFLGFIHAIAAPRRWDRSVGFVFIDMVFVVKNRRKMGIGSKLIEELQKCADDIGIKKLEFSCPDNQVDHWAKTLKADKIKTVMRADV
jgi:GNAT superfamily N-acetyltransferase